MNCVANDNENPFANCTYGLRGELMDGMEGIAGWCAYIRGAKHAHVIFGVVVRDRDLGNSRTAEPRNASVIRVLSPIQISI